MFSDIDEAEKPGRAWSEINNYRKIFAKFHQKKFIKRRTIIKAKWAKRKEHSQPTITWNRVEQVDGKQEEANQSERTVSASQIYLILFVHAKNTKSHLKNESDVAPSVISCCQTLCKQKQHRITVRWHMFSKMIIDDDVCLWNKMFFVDHSAAKASIKKLFNSAC